MMSLKLKEAMAYEMEQEKQRQSRPKKKFVPLADLEFHICDFSEKKNRCLWIREDGSLWTDIGEYAGLTKVDTLTVAKDLVIAHDAMAMLRRAFDIAGPWPAATKPVEETIAENAVAAQRAGEKNLPPPEAQVNAPKVIQIAAASSTYGSGQVTELLFALMDDGTMWRIPILGGRDGAREWQQVPPIPQVAALIPVVEFKGKGPE
jgi:hypothetical protein